MYKQTRIVFLLLMFFAGYAHANPTGGIVVPGSGSATIVSSPNALHINQSTNKAAIHWNSFNIAPNETVQFHQPSVNSVTLNRVNPAQGISRIQGQLQSNGQLILINQAGIAFGKGAIVNVGGIIASTSDISNKHFKQGFQSGQYQFNKVSHSAGASVTNDGTIIAADHGLVALMGSSVSNAGTIQADGGHVTLASGNQFAVDVSQDGLVNVVVDKAATPDLKTAKNNDQSDGNTISPLLLTADAAATVVDHAINMSGLIEADSVEQHNGEIVLLGGKDSTVTVTGSMNARGLEDLQTGGKVSVTGKTVLLTDHATINTNGDSGGGEINIGGDHKGQGPLQNADITTVDTHVNLSADAITTGNGGQITMYADRDIHAKGTARARGGVLSGKGGLIETSNHEKGGAWDISNTFSANDNPPPSELAKRGAAMWLIDPYDITISSSNANMDTTSSTYFSTGTPATLSADFLHTALVSGPITVTTSGASPAGTEAGNITIASSIADWASPYSLTLQADHDITIEDGVSITNSGSGGMTLQAGASINFDSTTTPIVIDTGGAQSYTAAGGIIVDANGATLTSANSDIALNSPVSGIGALSLTGGTGGDHIFTVTPSSTAYFTKSLSVTGDSARSNTLQLNSNGDMTTWNIGVNDGTFYNPFIPLGNFSTIQHLIDAGPTPQFNWTTNNSSIGSVVGVEHDATASMPAVAGPVVADSVSYTNSSASGTLSVGGTSIGIFSGVTTLTGPLGLSVNTLYAPLGSVVVYTNAPINTMGVINGYVNFYNFSVIQQQSPTPELVPPNITQVVTNPASTPTAPPFAAPWTSPVSDIVSQEQREDWNLLDGIQAGCI